ncbi:hypothetical protein PR048_021143 [Dryococelus australis]|uniref:PiggyBac transposable element-derived protein domain-containing protein n=1 Tax=Dryococelus australis TaxID=614101 RepID=A0ABQ9GXJ2_9NEOP|nr:hypothetical protein PR048_021143 [Dryococelus australis]
MIPYFDRQGCKQFLLLKPLRFGFKTWVMAQRSGYCLAAELNQDKIPMVRGRVTKALESQYSILLLLRHFFFTNTKITCSLSEKGMKGTGTAKINRMGKCHTADKKVMHKCERGSYEAISAVAWRDNNVVYTLSNEHGVQPVQYANRYSSRENKSLQVTQPNAIHKYNKFMGGVDLLDNNISNYRNGN